MSKGLSFEQQVADSSPHRSSPPGAVLRHGPLHRLPALQLQWKSVEGNKESPVNASRGPASSQSSQIARGDVGTYVWRLAGRRVTLQTLYFLRMVPQCVTSTLRPVTTEEKHHQRPSGDEKKDRPTGVYLARADGVTAGSRR
ncbi:hypothetical protein EYF80_050983 [Liparis tanakae]|uniref:Uncharacterized protein n=1 Tax=Liparis tanakae TaxID=230148 RepID=A0A4Z2FCZ9_9TELE|nr:hypothetical protein EYF80_050983 [Liparis tanakae]